MRDADAQLFRVRNADMSGFDRVLENVMATSHAPQYPAIGFELLDDLLAVHDGYYNHHWSKALD